jgi:hypothetical protein
MRNCGLGAGGVLQLGAFDAVPRTAVFAVTGHRGRLNITAAVGPAAAGVHIFLAGTEEKGAGEGEEEEEI